MSKTQEELIWGMEGNREQSLGRVMVEKPTRYPSGNVLLAVGAPGLGFQVRDVLTWGEMVKAEHELLVCGFWRTAR